MPDRSRRLASSAGRQDGGFPHRPKQNHIKRHLQEQGSTLQIRVADIQGKEAALLQSFKECSEGHCSCPTPEYQKLESMKVTPGANRIDIELQPKKGQSFVREDIEKCLDHTVQEAGLTQR